MLNEMTLIAKKYLGNITQDAELLEKVNRAKSSNKYLEVELQKSDRVKGRILTKSVSGIAIGIIKSRELLLESGDILETDNGDLIGINLQEETFMVLSFTDSNNEPLALVQLGHLLGNSHYPITIQDNKVYVKLVTNPKVIEQNIQHLNITGLEITYSNQPIDCKYDHIPHHHS